MTDEISNELKTAWAAHCGIALDDDRAQQPDQYGWPEQFAIFRAGWDAAAQRVAEMKAQIAERDRVLLNNRVNLFTAVEPYLSRTEFAAKPYSEIARLVIGELREELGQIKEEFATQSPAPTE